MKALIVKLGALGDVINTFPLAICLKKAGYTVDWLVAPLSFRLVSSHVSVDRAILFDRRDLKASMMSALRAIRQERYDLVLDLQRILKSGLFAMAARTRRRIGFDAARCKEMAWVFPMERIPARDPGAHMVDQYLEFAAFLNLACGRPEWKIPRSDVAVEGLPKAFAVLNIGATKSANLWSETSFARVADLTWEEYRLTVVLTGGPEDRPRASAIKTAAGSRVVDLTGRTTLPQLVEVIARARFIVSADTGPMHLASALDRPLVALFGPSDPRRTGPYQGHVITKNMDCAPCGKKTCDAPRCMDSILPEDVMAALRTLW